MLFWLMFCCTAIQSMSVLGSGGSCCSTGLPLLVMYGDIKEKSLTCASYSYCYSVTYFHDAPLSFDDSYFSNVAAAAAAIPSSLSTALVKHGKSSIGMVTIFSFSYQ